ncbi:MAG: GAF domain-containing protein [Elusimicrobiaceae bacterium]|nr:GAF domain-containing protein [Elusimicrobiaceae bacterium]
MLPESASNWIKLDSLLASLMHIHDISTGYTTSHSLNDLCQSVLNQACGLTGAKRGSVMIFNGKTQELEFTASRNLTRQVLETAHFKSGEGIAGRVYQSGESVVVTDPANDPNYASFIGAPEQQEPFAAIPIKTRTNIYGVLNLHDANKEDILNEYNLKLLSVLTGKAAMTIENMRLYNTLKNFNFDMVETLTRVIDAKDSYTHDHGSRARLKARSIAQALELELDEIEKIEYAALLHDIGKIGIREAVLLKPGRLTDLEYAEIKKHPEIGYQIISPVEFLADVSRMVLHHQEWYNGKGYPSGLAGEKIPLGSRIVSAIDAWDAMVSDRPYRRALPRETAIAELRNGAGTQFDPAIVDVFLALEEKEWRDTQGQCCI